MRCACLPACLPTRLLPACLPACLDACLPVRLPARGLPGYLPAAASLPPPPPCAAGRQQCAGPRVQGVGDIIEADDSFFGERGEMESVIDQVHPEGGVQGGLRISGCSFFFSRKTHELIRSKLICDARAYCDKKPKTPL